MIALLCLFGGVSIASWNALDVLTVELYPSDKRWGPGMEALDAGWEVLEAGCQAWMFLGVKWEALGAGGSILGARWKSLGSG